MDKIEAIYARQSIDKKDSVSIEAQVDFCKKYLISSNYKVYYDKGFSAKTIDRPQMNALNRDIESGKVSRVISYRLDRISRNIVDFGNLLTKYNKFDVEYISATENFDTSTPMGRAMVYIVMVFAQLERETIANRIADNYRFRSATGKYFMGGNVPFGYVSEKVLIDGKKASIIKPGENAPVLRKIFDRYLSGFNIGQIVKELNNDGTMTSNNKPWSSVGVKRVLRNITPCEADEKIYQYLSSYGYVITNSLEDFDGVHGMCIYFKSKGKEREAVDIKDRIVVVGLHEPLISSDQYIKAQIKLNKALNVSDKKTSKRTFLAGLIKCGACGYSFGIKTTYKKNREYSYYYCRSRHSRGICTNDLWINSSELEDYIIKRCLNYLDKLENEVADEVEDKNTTTNNDEIIILENQIENLISNIGKGNSVVDDLLTKKITQIQEKITNIKKESIAKLIDDNVKAQVVSLKKSLFKFETYDMDHKIAIINNLIESITITKNKNIDIKYKLSI